MTTINLVSNTRYTLSLAKKNVFRNTLMFYRNNTRSIKNVTVSVVSFFITYELLSYFYSINRWVELYYYIYWFLLGILSTIGFGFGLHTGTFFLIPNILGIYNETSVSNYNIDHIRYCVFMKSLPIVISWGIGSALGEMPPYLVSRYSKDDYNNMVNTLGINPKYIEYMKQYSFPVITMMASWPNMTFDFVGVLCGVNNISPMEFLIPTIVGKAFIKAPIQAFSVIYFYSEISDYISVTNNNAFYTIINMLFIIVIFYFTRNLIETLAHNEYKNK